MRGSDGLPEGWRSADGILAPRSEVAAYGARGQVVKGICRAKGCFRRLELNPKQLCGEGLGLLPIEKVQRLYACSRTDGCGLQFHAEPLHPFLPLGVFRGKPNVRLRLRCDAIRCTFFRVWTVEEMIAALEKKGQNGAGVDVHALGGLMTMPCKLCKKVSWKAEILWADVGTMGWRQLGERVFDKYGIG